MSFQGLSTFIIIKLDKKILEIQVYVAFVSAYASLNII